MHDAVIAQSILKDLGKQGEVLKAHLLVGELYGIEPAHLLEHLKEVSDIDFTVEQVPSRVKCSCGYQGRAKIVQRFHDFVLFECPACESTPDVLEGDKIVIGEVTCA